MPRRNRIEDRALEHVAVDAGQALAMNSTLARILAPLPQ
jgi:hypothetical protein